MPTTPEDGLKTDPPCHPQACAIQDCIQKNNYKEEKCQKQIRVLQPLLPEGRR
ncbi:hypothetical protein CB0940_00730 [Cercospora beticola]|uniref:Cx9C motif-containing protein 4, mitochondrial n=1 Tax=Cercospora beticola TaxID=122368 RepID=A0A2G5I9X9_CERBT|nr:hypothetical protein CB0940_00730 [Cercospora beticola]PIB01591.1 hypothetical protein CB0940_00730 [Cercospora beticola]